MIESHPFVGKKGGTNPRVHLGKRFDERALVADEIGGDDAIPLGAGNEGVSWQCDLGRQGFEKRKRRERRVEPSRQQQRWGGDRFADFARRLREQDERFFRGIVGPVRFGGELCCVVVRDPFGAFESDPHDGSGPHFADAFVPAVAAFAVGVVEVLQLQATIEPPLDSGSEQNPWHRRRQHPSAPAMEIQRWGVEGAACKPHVSLPLIDGNRTVDTHAMAIRFVTPAVDGASIDRGVGGSRCQV